jgi:hypothetical protein
VAPEGPADAVAQALGEAVSALTTLGNDLSVEEKKQAQPVAVAIIVSQVAQAAAAAVAASNTGRKK